ncbi:MAG: hypothetical protein EKK55_05530 [Rhodocyclaceae bacterium]|nr:MAG: hypothetical protein EKK55_05530 [Rhodocyclaceae bacterium]
MIVRQWPSVLRGVDGSISNPGVGALSERWGAQAAAAGANSVALGYQAQASQAGAIAIGHTCQVNGADSVVIGRNIQTSSANGVCIGAQGVNWANSVGVGTGANPGGTDAVAIGSGASAGAQCVMIGRAASGSGTGNIGIGYNVAVTGAGGATHSIGIGHSVATGFGQCIAIGGGATCTAAKQAVIGGPNTSITNVYLGKGVAHATPEAVTVQPTGGNANGVVGARLNLAGGKGGNAATAGGQLALQTAPAGAGTTLADRLIIEPDGNIAIFGAGSYGGGVGGVVFLKNATTPPTVAPTDGVVLWAEGGVLKAMGASGTPTTVAS